MFSVAMVTKQKNINKYLVFNKKRAACLCLTVAPVMERVSGNVVEFEMGSLTPATHYTVKVYAVRDLAKSAATTTEFTTGELLTPGTDQSLCF